MTFVYVIETKLDSIQRSKRGGEPGATWLRSRLARLRTWTGANVGMSEIGYALALAAPILVGLLVPVGDVGTAFSQQTELRRAAKSIHEKMWVESGTRPAPIYPPADR